MHTRSTNLILLAGLWLTGRAWDPVVAELAHLGQHATVPSLPGADDQVTTASLDEQVAAVVAAVDAAERPVVVGHFAASTLAWLAAGEIPELQRASVEEDWMEVRFAGLPDRDPWASVDWDSDPNWEFRTAAQLEPEQLRSRYREACDRSRHVVSNATGLDQLLARVLRDGRHFSLRWVLLHLVEETARHADFLRSDRRHGRCVADRNARVAGSGSVAGGVDSLSWRVRSSP